MSLELRDLNPVRSTPQFTSVNAAAQRVWMAWVAHQERQASPGCRQEPDTRERKAAAHDVRRARQIFLKALRALPLTGQGLTMLLENAAALVRQDIASLTAIYAHPEAPRCDPGALALLFGSAQSKWYTPEGLGILVRAMLERGAQADHGTADCNPLIVAVRISSAEAVEALLAGGASPEGLGSETTPLDPVEHPLTLACALGHVGCVKALLAGGARIDRLVASKLTWDFSNPEQSPRLAKSIDAWRECLDVIAAHGRATRMDQAWAPSRIDAPEETPVRRSRRRRF